MISLWAALSPELSRPALLATALLPVAALALVARFRGIVSINTSKLNPRPHVAVALFFPSCVMALRALDVEVVDLRRLFLIGVPIGILPAVVGVWIDPTVRWRWLAAALLGAWNLGYGVGGASLANSLLDSSVPTSYRAEIVDKRISGRRRPARHLVLAPWGPVKEREEVRVRKRLFDQVAEHDFVDVSLHEGALGARWCHVEPIEPAP